MSDVVSTVFLEV